MGGGWGGGVNKVFYGRCKNGEYVNNFVIIFVLILFNILHFKNARSTFGKISFVRCPFMNCFAVLFSSLMDLK